MSVLWQRGQIPDVTGKGKEYIVKFYSITQCLLLHKYTDQDRDKKATTIRKELS